MGNNLPLPCVCHHEDNEADGTTAAGAKKRRRQKSLQACRNVRAAARPRHVVPVVDVPAEDGDGAAEEEGEVVNKEAWRPGCRVEPAGNGGEDGGVRRVKIVMRRKDIAELVARLQQRDEAERDATVMEELSTTGLGGGDGNVHDGSVTMSPCRDAWRPRLSIIPENY